MTRLKIGVDVDGVVADFIEAFRVEAESVLGRSIVGPSKDWDFTNWMTSTEQSRVWAKLKATPNWFELYLHPLPGVVRTLPRLVNNHEVSFISTRIETAGDPVRDQTINWLWDIIVHPQVIITKDKGKVCNALGIQVFIDDKPENLEDIAKYSPSTKLFLQDTSYNQSAKIGTRVSSFEAFVDKVL